MVLLVLSELANPAYGAPPQLVSERAASSTQSVAGNDNSISPVISADGRFVLFSSAANNLVTNDNGYLGLDVFLHDRASNATVLVSIQAAGLGGGNDHSRAVSVSTNGRYVLFESDATNLLVGDTNGVGDVFVRDLQLNTTLLVSTAAGGGWGNGASTESAMTPDGRWVTFVSAAANLVTGDTNGSLDLFVRDLVAGATRCITVGSTGANSMVTSPVITPDGRFVAFSSTARNLAPGVPVSSRGEVYLADLLANTVAWVSTNASVTTSNILRLNSPPSYHPALSDDGRYVAFKCGWTNGTVAPPLPGRAATIVFLFDSLSGATTLLTTNGYAPLPYDDDLYGPEMTPDGRFVAYVERETTLATNFASVRLWDRLTATNVLASAAQGGVLPINTVAHTPVVSSDGRYVTFLSDATNLVVNVVSNGLHLYRRDLLTDTTMLVDTDTNGIGSSDHSGVIPAMSGDGRFVVYCSDDGSLIAGDNNRALDVFLRDAATATNQLISTRHPTAASVAGNAMSALGLLSLSGDGGAVAFASYASDLATNDFNGEADVFVRDLATGSNVLVSVGLDGSSASGGSSHSPVISGDGRLVVFISGATNLVAGDTNAATDVFQRDLIAGSTMMLSVNSSGVSLGDGDCSSPVASQDGRYVAFLCKTNISGNTIALFWRDVVGGVTRLVNGSVLTVRPISISSDGQRVAYFDNATRLYIWDATPTANIYTNTTSSLMSAAIAPTGNKLLYQTANQLSVRDLAFGTNQLLYSTTVQIKSPAQWSGDGRFVAFVTAAGLIPGDANGTNDVYLRDLQTGTLTLVSVNQTGTASAAGASDYPVFSLDGRYVAFRSWATDIAPGVIKPPSLVLFSRETGTNSVLATGTIGNGWTSWLVNPAVSTNGAMLAFQSWDSGLLTGDLNRAGDVFTGDVVVLPRLDSDSDGIPDWWMSLHFGHPTGQAVDSSRATDDADGDGVSNGDEFAAGTDPQNAGSVLALRITTPAMGSVMLNWDAVAGRNYQVLTTPDLNAPNWQVASGSALVFGGQGYFNMTAVGTPRYFRVLCNH